MKQPQRLICSCCDQVTTGRQWWNRDTGYGLCSSCADRISESETSEQMRRCYGERGVHYDLKR